MTTIESENYEQNENGLSVFQNLLNHSDNDYYIESFIEWILDKLSRFLTSNSMIILEISLHIIYHFSNYKI